MSFDNNYPNRKDQRKPFIKAKAIDVSCRNHGSCPYCHGNRTIKEKKNDLAAIEELKTLEYEFEKEGCAQCLQEKCNCAEEFEENELNKSLIGL